MGALSIELFDLECLPFPVTITTNSGESSPHNKARWSSSSHMSSIVQAAPTDSLPPTIVAGIPQPNSEYMKW